MYLDLLSQKVDFAGLSYWLRSIKTGSYNISDWACDLIGSLSNSRPSINEKEIIYRKALDNKVNSAELFTEELASTINGVSLYKPSCVNPWISGHALSVGVEFISQVNPENQFSIIEVKNCIQSIILFWKSSNYKPIIEIEGESISIPVFSNNKKFTKMIVNTLGLLFFFWFYNCKSENTLSGLKIYLFNRLTI